MPDAAPVTSTRRPDTDRLNADSLVIADNR
jgi:hypothetical protein